MICMDGYPRVGWILSISWSGRAVPLPSRHSHEGRNPASRFRRIFMEVPSHHDESNRTGGPGPLTGCGGGDITPSMSGDIHPAWASEVRLIGIAGLPEITVGADLSSMIANAAASQGVSLEDGDVLVVTQKVVSKAEGRTIDLADVEPSDFARQFAMDAGRDPRLVEAVLRESVSIVRMDSERGILITETRHGFVCANSGIDSSNVEGEETVTLLPEDPDESAVEIMRRLKREFGLTDLAVIVTDTFGRAWREGHINFAIGVAGMGPFIDYRGQVDVQRRVMSATRIAVADEIAAAAELVMGKVDQVPVAVVRGCRYVRGNGNARELVRERGIDLFR